MSTNHTPNYALSLWEPEDQVVRTEFNENHAKIDAALAALAEGKASTAALEALRGQVLRIVTGTYTGNGAETRVISLGFTPKAVYVCARDGQIYQSGNRPYYYGGLAVTGCPCTTQEGELVTIKPNGFQVSYYTRLTGTPFNATNLADKMFNYFAIG